MPSLSTIRAEMMASIAVKQAILKDEHLLGQVESLAMQCLDALKAGGKVIFAGNGGSFADAQHLSAEFVSRFNIDRAPLASLALGTNNSAFSAIGNDYGFDQVFARELEAVAKREDVFVGISTSGNSANVIAAVDKALELNVAVTCLTGQSGGKLIERCTSLCVPSTETARIQECHITIGHIICGLVENMYFSKGNS
jgi:D-sedoheptulose 7-phosphate isomerase